MDWGLSLAWMVNSVEMVTVCILSYRVKDKPVFPADMGTGCARRADPQRFKSCLRGPLSSQWAVRVSEMECCGNGVWYSTWAGNGLNKWPGYQGLWLQISPVTSIPKDLLEHLTKVLAFTNHQNPSRSCSAIDSGFSLFLLSLPAFHPV